MGSVHNENIHQIIELCCELLTLVQTACGSERHEGGSILVYTHISECASRIQGAAEERREDIALGKLEQAMTWDGGRWLSSAGTIVPPSKACSWSNSSGTPSSWGARER